MGIIHKFNKVDFQQLDDYLSPIIFVEGHNAVQNKLEEFSVLSLNRELSERLLNYKPEKRKLFVEDEIVKLYNRKEGKVLIKDIEILFDPEFSMDIIRLFILLNRKRKTAVLWPGKYRNGKLIFSEMGYKDYHAYDITKYDITCII